MNALLYPVFTNRVTYTDFKHLYVYHCKLEAFSGCTPRIMMSFCILHVFISIIMIMIVIVMIITGAAYVSQLLNVTQTLQKLSVSYNDIGDDGMALISEALQHRKSLTALWVAECGLSVKGTVVCKMLYGKMLGL